MPNEHNQPSERKKLLLRLDPAVHDALAHWAGDELRSTNAQIEFLLRRALGDAGRLPGTVGRIRRPGRPPASRAERQTRAESLPPDSAAPQPSPRHMTIGATDHTDPGSSAHTEPTPNDNSEEP
jgi:hypothetical protein